MALLKDVISSLFIQNQEVYNFFNYFVNRNSNQGIFKYTTDNGFRKDNLFSNYEGGKEGRYGYKGSNNVFDDTTASYRLSEDGGSLVKTKDVNSEARGEGYRVKDTENSRLKFITKAEFLELGKLLADRNVGYRNAYLRGENRYKEYGNISPQDYTNGEIEGTVINEKDEIKSLYSIKDYERLNNKYIHDEIKSEYAKFTERAKAANKNLFKKRYALRGDDSGTKYIEKYYIASKFPESIYTTKKAEEVKYDIPETLDSEAARKQTELEITRFLDTSTSIIKERGANVASGFTFSYNLWEEYNVTNIIKEKSILGKDGIAKHYSDKYKGYGLVDLEKNIFSGYNVGYYSNILRQETKKGNVTYTYYAENNISEGNSTTDNSSIVIEQAYDLKSFPYNTYDLFDRVNALFSSGIIQTMINREYNERTGDSRGRALKGKNGKDYCRVWTAKKQYSKMSDRMRPFYDEDGQLITMSDLHKKMGGLRAKNGATRIESLSVLNNNGTLKFSPTNGGENNIKNYMFSIENLAWKDDNNKLSSEQIGPNHGRIMWFPPYNLRFTENINTQWNENDFIGRGEKIYTYVNTTRGGTLSFTMLIDHPSILNKWRGNGEVNDKQAEDERILRFFAGKETLDNVLSTPSKKVKKQKEDDKPKKDPVLISRVEKHSYFIFFPEDFSGKDYMDNNNMGGGISLLNNYEESTSGEVDYHDKSYSNITNIGRHKNTNRFNLNGDGIHKREEFIKKALLGGKTAPNTIYSYNEIEGLDKKINGAEIFGKPSTTCKIRNIKIEGHRAKTENESICLRRSNFAKSLLLFKFDNILEENISIVNADGKIGSTTREVDDIQNKVARSAVITFEIEWKEEVCPSSAPVYNSNFYVSNKNMLPWDPKGILWSPEKENIASNTIEESTVTEEYAYDKEYLYFKDLAQTDAIYHKNLVDQIRFFNPAFHSITPEGFNARLSFLQQCTRQGPTKSLSGGNVNSDSPNYLKYAGNLAFGRAPYCVLRIGDFFNTKICISSISIQYDNGGVQWDLNAEGAGVQPMYANVDITFNFIGGQDIGGTVEVLQNAISSNYYANESIYNNNSTQKSPKEG